MKKSFIKLLLLVTIPFTLMGCSGKKDEPITDKEESTIIKDAKSVDPYLKNKDYKSIAYAYIYNIKEGLKSYESESNGTVKAKVAFINYNIVYNSVTHKKGNAFYSRDHSKSTFSNVENEFYQADREKILVSRDLKKYNVYTVEEYNKVSYASTQYLIMGYVFNDESIIQTELISDKDDDISIKYTLHNDLATKFVKTDMKVNGNLSTYPEFDIIEMTLKMKRDFTPISYAIHAIYDASAPIIGSAKTTQEGECIFRKINEDFTIPNEAFLASQLGTEPSRIVIDDKEQSIKDDLLNAAKNLDFAHGVNGNGALTLNLFNNQIALNMDFNLAFDIERLSEDKIYNVFSFYAKLAGDEYFNSLASLIKTLAADRLGEYANLFDEFKSLEIVYDGDGGVYFVPTNQSDIQTNILKGRLTDIADLILQRINVYNLVSGTSQDLLVFNKIEGKDANNYQVEITLTPDALQSLKDTINKLFEDSTYSILKTVLSYKDLDSIKAVISVADSKIKDLEATVDYIQETEEGDKKVTIAKLNLTATEKSFNFAEKITYAQELYADYQSVLELKSRMTELSKNVYVSRSYLKNVQKALDEYEALTDRKKNFVGPSLAEQLQKAIKDVDNVTKLIEGCAKYDFVNLTNRDIYELSKLYYANDVNFSLLRDEMGEEKYSVITNLSRYIDYSSFDGAINKFVGDDENSWGLTNQEIIDIKLLFDIAEYQSSVETQMMLNLLLSGNFTSVATIKEKISNLYSKIINQ